MKNILLTKNSTNYLENIKVLLNSKLCSHELKVEFAVFAASGLEKYYDAAKYPKVKAARQRCLELVAKWLVDKNSVTQEELRVVTTDAVAAANAAADAANAAADYAAYAAANAAYATANATANAAYAAAYAAADAANAAAADAANSSDYAAYAAAYAAYLQKLYNWLFTRLTENLNTNTIEVLYGSI